MRKYDERIEEIVTQLREGRPIHAKMTLGYLIKDLGYD